MPRVLRWGLVRRVTLPVLITLSFSLILIFLYTWKLGSLTPGLSPAEVEARNSSQSIQAIISNPINGPHRVLQYGFQQINVQRISFLRLSSAIFGLIFLGCFYLVVRVWFGRIVGLLGALLVAGTPWMIIIGRSATPEIMLLAPLLTAASYVWLLRSNHKAIAWSLLLISVAISLYSPGGIWWITLGIILTFKNLLKTVKELNVWTIFCSAVLLILLLLPLGRAIFDQPAIVKQLLLLPDNWPPIIDTLKSIVWSGLGILWRTAEHTALNVGRLPLLNAAQIALLVFGTYAMWNHARTKMYALLVIIFAGVIIAGVNEKTYLIILTLPAIGILVAAGLRYLYIEWLSVFPRNPLPRTLALLLMTALVALHLFYGVRYSLIAWPTTIDTRQVYMLK